MPASIARDALSFRTKFWFGVGASGESATNWIFNALTFLYYQQILGLSGTLTGTAVFIAIVSDAISDPIMGSISDRFQSRFGRRHPFMFAAPIPLVASIYLIFYPPAAIVDSQPWLFAWFTVMTVLMRTFTTLFAIPHLAMGAELSADYIERSKVMSFNNLFGFYGGFAMHCFVWFFVFDALYGSQGGQLYRPAYLPIVLFCCALVLVTIFGCAWFTRDQIPRMRAAMKAEGAFTFVTLLRDMWLAVSNRHYRFLLLGLFFLAMTIGTHETLGIYMATYFWQLSPFQIGWLVLNNLIGYHIGFFGAAFAHRRIDKRWTIVAAAAGLSFFWSLPVNLGLLGFAPARGSWELVAFMIGIFAFSSTFGSILNISVMSALADITDEHELHTGRRQEGIFYSARTFFSKMTNGVGHVVAGIALDVYITLPSGAVPGQVPADTLFRLGVVDGPFAMVWGFVGAALYAGYRIDRRYHAQVRAALNALRDNQ